MGFVVSIPIPWRTARDFKPLHLWPLIYLSFSSRISLVLKPSFFDNHGAWLFKLQHWNIAPKQPDVAPGNGTNPPLNQERVLQAPGPNHIHNGALSRGLPHKRGVPPRSFVPLAAISPQNPEQLVPPSQFSRDANNMSVWSNINSSTQLKVL